MNKQTITAWIGENESMRVEAYVAPVEGLAIHRQVAYLPGKEEHKFTSKWQITHIKSGQALLRPSECLDTMADAVEIAKKLDSIDWTKPKDELSSPEVGQKLADALVGVERSAPTAADHAPVRRFLVKRNREGAGYVVWDDDMNEVVEVFVHRGLASERAKELNGKVST